MATVILMVALVMDLMDSTITNVALPAIGNDLGANPAQLEWTLAGYVVAFATLLITGGRIGDIFGRRRVFVIGVAGFTVASLLASFSPTGDTLVATRILQGAFAGIMVPQVLSSVQVMYKPEERGPIFGIVGALSALGAVTGLLLGGWLVTINAFDAGWRSIFLINIPVGAVLIIASLLFVPNSRSEAPPKLDIVGTLLGAATVFLIVFPLTDARQADWAWWIWAMLAAAPIILVLFVLQQKRKLRDNGSALLPMTLFRNHGFASGSVVQVLSSIGNGSYALVIIFYVQQTLGFTPLAAGLTILPLAIGSMVATAAAIPLAKKFGKHAVVLGGTIQAAAFVWVMLAIVSAGDTLTGWNLVLPLGLAGAGMMILIMPQMELTLATVPTAEAGAASGTLTTLGQVGMVLGVTLPGSIFFGRITDGASPQDGVITALLVTVTTYL
ncbi:MFS transporter, partial [Glaciihabitans sp. UYNi722]|uniref:MFS transporter n=1 Tax=Glaciihabitans sp. UYNi722 TaxID=3156344 RepID=UPI003393EFC1